MRLSRTAGNRCGECATYVISLSPGLDPHCFILSFTTADVRSRHARHLQVPPSETLRRQRTANPARGRGGGVGGGGGGGGEGEARRGVSDDKQGRMFMHEAAAGAARCGARLTRTDRVARGEGMGEKKATGCRRCALSIFTRFARAHSCF